MGAYRTVQERDGETIADVVAVWSHGYRLSPHNGDRASIRTFNESQIVIDRRERTFYSYGRHFPLAHFCPRVGRQSALWIINGDTWTGARGWNSRTNGHQSDTRAAIAASGIASIVLPMSAIAGAAIEWDSLRPIHVREDTTWKEYDRVPREVDLDALETAHTVTPFDGIPSDVRGPHGYDARAVGETWGDWADRTGSIVPFPVGTKFEWRDSDGVKYARTLYRRASVDTGERSEGGYPIATWQENGADDWITAPVSEHGYRGGNDELVRRADGWHAVRNMHRLGDALFSAVRNGRRARFLSSFDYNENPPLYFLAQVPRGAGGTIESALDALAPRAVHAAYARGLDVKRQGDIFFVPTTATRDSLAARGATFARLTQWTREAKPRAGEVNYRAPLTAAERRRMESRERKERARIWRESFRHSTAPLGRGTGLSNETETERSERRARTASLWRELLTRHAAERAIARAAGIALDALESSACDTCGAAIGAACLDTVAGREGLTVSLAARIDYDRERDGAHKYRQSIARRHDNERSALQRDTERGAYRIAGAPQTKRNGRADHAERRRVARVSVEGARVALRRASLGTVPSYLNARRNYGETQRGAALRARADYAKKTRADYADALERYARAMQGRVIDRDAYRRPFNQGRTSEVALITWGTARVSAAMKVRPHTVEGSPDRIARRERVRRVLALYGTSHSATEVARIGAAWYVRGTVYHVPELEPGRAGGRDHAAITLGDTWYLALRNRVPRQR